MTRRGACAVAGAALLAVAACGAPRGAAPVATPALANRATARVAIVVMTASRGPAAAAGRSTLGGVAVALGELADAAALPVAALDRIDLDLGDGTAAEVRAAAAGLVRRTDVIAVVAAVAPDATLAAAEALADLPGVVIQTEPPVEGWNEVALVVPPEVEAAATARFVADTLRARAPATLGDPWSPEVRTFAEHFEMLGTRVVRQTYPIGEHASIDPLGDLARAGVDALYLAGPPGTLAGAAREASLRGLAVPLVVRESWAIPEALAVLDHAGVDAYVVTTFALDDGTDVTRDFAARFRREVGGEPDRAAGLAYDGTRLVIAALRAAPMPAEPASVRATLPTLDPIPGLSGPLTVDAAGRARRPIAIRHRRGGIDELTAIVR